MGETEEMGEKPSLGLRGRKGVVSKPSAHPPCFFQSSFEVETLLCSSPPSATVPTAFTCTPKLWLPWACPPELVLCVHVCRHATLC